ncbi:MAG: recombinase family protein [Bacilli bacterium]|nr:recombinase family protein [Bacilli bacterium]
MEEKSVNAALYPRVSTEDQSRFGHSLDEQEDKLKQLCEFKGYNIYKIYREEGVSAKNMERPKFKEMIQDMKDGKINKIIVYKLDRLTRSIKDLETICTTLEEYHCDLESVAEEINTSNANGKFFIRMLTILAQLEIERTSERTIFGLVGAYKKGHISGKVPFGYSKNLESKDLIINNIEAEIVKDIYKLYLEGKSVNSICKDFNQRNVYNKKWSTTSVDKLLSNQIYIGNIVSNKTNIYENVVPAIIDKTTFDMVQKRKEKNIKNYMRKQIYMFMQKIKCPKCKRIMGGNSGNSKSGEKHCYYYCPNCNIRINEKRIEKSLIKFLNDMLDFFLIIDNSFKPQVSIDTENDLKKYKKLKQELLDKENRIKKAFIDGILEANDLKNELDQIKLDIERTQKKLIELENLKENMINNQDYKLLFNAKEIEKMKYKSNYVKTHNLWLELSKDQKQFIINKYINEIEISINHDYSVNILNISFNKNEIENIGYMFRNDCFDMVINLEKKDVLLSSYKDEEDTQKYISNLRDYYNIKETKIDSLLFDINNYRDDIIEIIPQEKSSKFNKEIFTILQIENKEE